jgi:hypothetical protein
MPRPSSRFARRTVRRGPARATVQKRFCGFQKRPGIPDYWDAPGGVLFWPGEEHTSMLAQE